MDNDKQKNIDQAKPLKIITKSYVLWFILVCCFFVAISIYFLYGSTDDIITKTGYMITDSSRMEVHEPYKGVITKYFITMGDYVEKDEVIAKVYNGDLVNQLNVKDLSTDKLLDESIDILSPCSGYVYRFGAKLWDEVNISTPIVSIFEDKVKGFQHAVVFTTSEEIGKLHLAVGSGVRGYLEGVNKKEYGNISGKIIKISELIDPDIISFYLNVEYDPTKDYYILLIEFDNKDGELIYSSGKTPENEITLGTPCRIDFIVTKRKFGSWFY